MEVSVLIIVSSCLLGMHAKYDGSISNKNELLQKYSHLGRFIPVCPEQLGGLPTPRPPAEITEGSGESVLEGKARVRNILGEDISSRFVKGAEQLLYIAKAFPVKAAILKERSPSCGVHGIYDGNFSGSAKKGRGVAAALLKQNKIPVYSEEELTEELLRKLLEVENGQM